MAKIVLSDVTSSYSTSTINSNFSKIEDALNNEVLYRNNPAGEINQMESSLDMNSNDILNVGKLHARVVTAETISNGEDFPIEGEVDDNELLKWDADISRFVGTGIFSHTDGEITTNTNSVNIGAHDMGSFGRNVGVTNRVDGRHWVTILQEVGIQDSQNTNAIVHEHGSLETYQFGTSSISIVNAPSWEFEAIVDQTVFGIRLWPAMDMTDIEYVIYDSGIPIFQANIGSFTENDNSQMIELPTPYDLYGGKRYTASLRALDGSVCLFRGSDEGYPWYEIMLRPFTSKELATEEYVDNSVGSIVAGDMYKSVYDTTDSGVVDKAEMVDGADSADPSSYYGTDELGNVGFHELPMQPLPESSVVLVSFMTTDGTGNLYQTLSNDDVPETVTYNSQELFSTKVSVNTTSGEFTFLEATRAVFSASLQVVRQQGTGGDAEWGFFIEKSIDNGTTWTPVQGSTRRKTISSNMDDEPEYIDYTTVMETSVGEMLRIRHFTNRASQQLAVVSADSDNGAPVSSGATVSIYMY